MTESPQSQQPYSGIPGPGGYPPPQQGPYGQPPQPPQGPYGMPYYGQYGPPPPSKNNNVKIGLAAGLGLMLLVGGGVAIHIFTSAHRDANGNIDKKGDLNAFSVKVGDCISTPSTGDKRITSVTAIPCTQPHSAQVFAVYTYPNAPDDKPSDADLTASAKSQCMNLASTALDLDKVPGDADILFLYPEAQAWSAGKHDIQCVVSTSGTPFTSSVLK